MFEIMEQTTESCIGVRVSGEIRANDYRKLEPLLTNAIKAHGIVNLVVHLEDLEGIEDADALREDVKLALKSYGDIGKIAVLGTEKWQEWAAKLMDPILFTIKVAYFGPDAMEEAWDWACGAGWKA